MIAIKPHYASVNNPTIEATTSGLFRFQNMEQALERLASIKDFFITSHNQPENSDASLILWINGYAITENEKNQGYLGNYAMISAEATDDNKFTLTTTKLESELKYHPQRKRLPQKHPNWGHPILRAIKKGRVFGDVEEVRSELQRLHEEFPSVSIPCTNKMYIIIYGKVEGSRSPVQKYVLEIKISEGGGYIVEYNKNDYTAEDKASQPAAPTTEGAEPKELPNGYFTSMVKLKRKN